MKKRIICMIAVLVSICLAITNINNSSAASFRAQINIINSHVPEIEPDIDNTGTIEWVTDQAYIAESGEEAVFDIKYDLRLFKSVKINDQELELNTDYLLEEGSTVVVLKADYMNRLSPGTYEVKAEYSDGQIFTTSFTVKNASEEVVPETTPQETPQEEIIVPDTGGNHAETDGISDLPLSNILVTIVTIASVIMLIIIIKKRTHTIKIKHQKREMKITRKQGLKLSRFHWAPLTACLLTIIVGIGIGARLFISMGENNAKAALVDIPDSLAISASSDEFTQELDLSSGSAFTSTWQEISVDTATKNGYQLFISTNSDEYNDLSMNGSEAGDERIVASLGTSSAPLAMNGDEWGYALNGGAFGENYTPSDTSLWAGVPTYGSGALLKTVYGPTNAGDKTKVYYGFHVTNNLPDGSYWGTENSTVVYIAVANVVPEYAIEYNCNGGTGTIEKQTKQMGDTVELRGGTGCTRDGYNLLRWNTTASGLGQDYAFGESYSNDANLYLYAVWEKIEPGPEPDPEPTTYTYVLQYDANGGTGAPASQSTSTTELSATFVISGTQPTRSGYTFKGWNRNSGATTAEFVANSSIAISSNTTLYAVWEIIPPTKVSSITIGGSTTIDYNGANTTQLTATVTPADAANKTVTWSSSDNRVATVSSTGLVTGVNAGPAAIYARANDGSGVVGTYIVDVRKEIVIVIGASQVARFGGAEYANIQTYTSPTQRRYVRNNTLFFKYKSGSGFDYQYNEGWSAVYGEILAPYELVKNYVDFYIYLPMPGNSIKTFTCDQISSSNSTIRDYANMFAARTRTVLNNGYHINSTIVSVQPVKYNQSTSTYVVANSSAKRCDVNYRSNYKYYQFNKTMMGIIGDNFTYLNYLPLFADIMNTSNSNQYTFRSGWTDYATTDGIHWDNNTAVKYLNAMLNKNSPL